MDTIRRKLVPMILLLPALCIGGSFAARAQETEFNTVLFQATFKIEGPAGPNSVTLGTFFFMTKPIAGIARRSVPHSPERQNHLVCSIAIGIYPKISVRFRDLPGK